MGYEFKVEGIRLRIPQFSANEDDEAWHRSDEEVVDADNEVEDIGGDPDDKYGVELGHGPGEHVVETSSEGLVVSIEVTVV